MHFGKQTTNYFMNHSTRHILSDFNRTLTCAYVDGKKTPSLISVLRDNDFLDDAYAQQAHTYFDHYSPLEQDPQYTYWERKALMHERRSKHFALLIEKWLSQHHIRKVTHWWYMQLRPWVKEFLQKTHRLAIPFVIISSNGLWAECIRQFLDHQWVLYSNIHIISNEYIWSDNGVAIWVKQPIIHSLNKDETTLQEFSFGPTIAERKNIILLWDSLGDLAMSDWFDYDSRTTIGFVNHIPETPDHIQQAYENAFDYCIYWDWDFTLVDQVFEELIA